MTALRQSAFCQLITRRSYMRLGINLMASVLTASCLNDRLQER
jgi:hypothetical protein